MYENVFKRIEQKYLLTKEKKKELFKLINKNLKKDIYYDTTICNIYFDNKDKDLIINSLEKPIYKDKVRLRSYGVPSLESNVFLEIKNKYEGIVGKRRIMIKLKDYYDYIEGNYNNNNQIMKEIDYLFKYYKLEPFRFVGYHRFSYVDRKTEKIRITFDDNLTGRDYDLQLEKGLFGDKYFNNDETIMEIKTENTIPLWLVNALSKLKIYPVSFSKLGSIYNKRLMEDVYV